MSYPLDRTSKASLPDKPYSTPSITTSTSPFVGSRGKASHHKRTSNAKGGSLAQPGKVLSKQDRQKRIQSATQPEPAKSWEEQRAEDLSFRRLYENLKSWEVLHAINASFRDNLAPEAAATAVHDAQASIRHLIVLLISFLIVFGLGWNAITYFITVTSVSAQCTASTVYSTLTVPVPVTFTYTYTESIYMSSTACTTTSADVDPAATKSDPSTTIMPMSTSTSTSYSTTTVTVLSATPSQSSVSISSTLPYVFSVNSGSTSWVNGVSPSSGALLITATTTIFITPSDASNPLQTSSTTTQMTRTHTTTITPSAETSTSTTFVSPDVTLTTRITRTSTVTPTSTVTRSSFGGMGGSGWNMTSSQDTSNVGSVTAAAAEGTSTTATISYFWASSGGQTYSTSTKVITTTLYHSHASGWMPTVPPMSTSLSGSLLSRNSSSTMTDVDGSSSFPTMSPGTDGINPALGAGTASSGLATTSPESFTSPVLGMTGPATGLTPTSSSISSAPNATVSNVGITPESATGAITETDPSASSSALNSSTVSSQNASSTVSGNSTPSTSSVDAGTTKPSGTGASEAGAAGTSINQSASDVPSTPTLSPTASSSVGSMTSSSSSTAFANTSLTSVVPSTQVLTSIGSSLANGPAIPTPSSASSLASSSQTVTSTGSSTSSASTTSSKTSASASASPTACGEHGDFTLDFDDLPAFSGDEYITQAPPIFSPYHHLTFSNGYIHGGKPHQPFAPHSGDQLAVFLASGNGTNDTTWHQNGLTMNAPRTEPGEITDGPYDGLPAFWFNAKGAWLGCDNDGPEPCVFNITGWTWDSQLGDEVATYNTQIELPPCPGFENCQLQQVDFPESFRGLSGIQIQAFANKKPGMFFMDDLALSWFDNSCAAGMQRMGRPGSFGGPGRSGGGGRKIVVRRSLMC